MEEKQENFQSAIKDFNDIKLLLKNKLIPLLKKDKKITILLSVLVLLVMLLLVASAAKPKYTTAPKATNVPKTGKALETQKRQYVNYTHNYSLSVPENWLTEEGGFAFIGSSGEVVFVPTDSEGNKIDDVIIAITVMPDSGGRYQLSGKTEYDKWLTNPPSIDPAKRLYKTSDARLSGIPAVEFVESSLPNDPGKSYFRKVTWVYTDKVFHPIKPGTFWNIYVEISSSKEPTPYYDDYKTIIDSFNILSPNSTAVTPVPVQNEEVNLDSDFIDDRLDFRIEYPSSWQFIRTFGYELKNDTGDVASGLILGRTVDNEKIKEDITLEVMDAKGLTDVNDWINLYDSNYPKSTARTELKFKTLNAVRLIFKEETGEKETLYFIQKKYLFRITAFSTPTISSEARAIINSLDPFYTK